MRAGASSHAAAVASYVVPGAVVATLILLLIRFQGQIETGTANVANLLPIGYAFAAGMVASVNPCGVLLLPSYVSYQLGGVNEQASSTSPLSGYHRPWYWGEWQLWASSSCSPPLA